MAFFLETLLGGLMAGMLYSLVALGFVLIYKASGVFNFAQGAMVLFAALAMARFAMEFCAIESCGKCTPCRIGAVRGVETIDRIGRGDAAAIPLLTDLCETMKFGSLCALGGFTPYPVMSVITHFRTDLKPTAAAQKAE